MPTLTTDGLAKHLLRTAAVPTAKPDGKGQALVLHRGRPGANCPARPADTMNTRGGVVVLGILVSRTSTNHQSHLVEGTSAQRHRLSHTDGATVPPLRLHHVEGRIVLRQDGSTTPGTVPRLGTEAVPLVGGRIVIQAPPLQTLTSGPRQDPEDRSGDASTIVTAVEGVVIAPQLLTMTPLPQMRGDTSGVPPPPPLALTLAGRADRDPRQPGSMSRTCHLVGKKQPLPLFKPVVWPC